MCLTAKKPSLVEILTLPCCVTGLRCQQLPRRQGHGDCCKTGRRYSDKLSALHTPPDDLLTQTVVVIVELRTSIHENHRRLPFRLSGGSPNRKLEGQS